MSQCAIQGLCGKGHDSGGLIRSECSFIPRRAKPAVHTMTYSPSLLPPPLKAFNRSPSPPSALSPSTENKGCEHRRENDCYPPDPFRHCLFEPGRLERRRKRQRRRPLACPSTSEERSRRRIQGRGRAAVSPAPAPGSHVQERLRRRRLAPPAGFAEDNSSSDNNNAAAKRDTGDSSGNNATRRGGVGCGPPPRLGGGGGGGGGSGRGGGWGRLWRWW